MKVALLFCVSVGLLLLLASPASPYFFINPDAPITLGFILNMPISLALPTLIDTTRSLKDGGETEEERSAALEYPEDLFMEPSYEQQLGALGVYFSYLKVASVDCQEQLICEIAADPATFSPLSELVLKELKQANGPVKPAQDSLYWRYMAASATGYAYDSAACLQYYSTCPRRVSAHISMSALKVWQFLASKIGLKLVQT